MLSLALIFLLPYYLQDIRFAEPLLGADLTEVQAKQVDITAQAAQQLLTLATLVLAGIGVFASNAAKGSQNAIPKALLVSAALAALSIYMGYLLLDRVVWCTGSRSAR